MKRFMQIALVAAVVAMTAGSALAQERQRQRQGQGGGFGRFGGGGGVLFVLGQKSVQEELKLSGEQVKKVQELATRQRPNFADFQGLSREEIQKKMAERTKAQNEALAKIIDEKQLKRAKEIALQQPGAINNPEVAKALNITDEQREKMREIQMKSFEEMRDLGRDEAGAKKREEVRKATNEKVMGVLTAEQKTKLKEMQGEPFKGKIERPQFGGGGRRNRQN